MVCFVRHDIPSFSCGATASLFLCEMENIRLRVGDGIDIGLVIPDTLLLSLSTVFSTARLTGLVFESL